ncbi:hypothetical protein NQ318_007716 [Aromia moschata]|uniref:Uncharacterized protein n=1 Tax=Aromia moschata TaxID=1265417 RepID=A0AAV8Z240_9CUCU|nr:hypothetical protein NQ318_007716 [Aromia moschata]
MEWTNDLTIEFLQMYEKELMNVTGCKKEQESELYYEGIRNRAFAKSSHSVGAKRMLKIISKNSKYNDYGPEMWVIT